MGHRLKAYAATDLFFSIDVHPWFQLISSERGIGHQVAEIPLAGMHFTLGRDEHALAVKLVLEKGPHISAAVAKGHFTFTVELVFHEPSDINVTVGKTILALSVHIAGSELSGVYTAIGKGEDALAVHHLINAHAFVFVAISPGAGDELRHVRSERVLPVAIVAHRVTAVGRVFRLLVGVLAFFPLIVQGFQLRVGFGDLMKLFGSLFLQNFVIGRKAIWMPFHRLFFIGPFDLIKRCPRFDF